MEITKDLKEKLLKANSLEEIKILFADQATEEEMRRIWHEIQKNRASDDLVETDDDELEAVSGGKGGNDVDAADGHERSCYFWFHRENECPNSRDGLHYWRKTPGEAYSKCSYCGATSLIASIGK